MFKGLTKWMAYRFAIAILFCSIPIIGKATTTSIFSLSVTSSSTLTLAYKASSDLSSYATISGGSATIYNGKNSTTAQSMVKSKVIKLGGSSGSYVKVTLSGNTLAKGDVITITTAGSWKISTSASNSSAIKVTAPYTITGSESISLAGASTFYLWKTGSSGDPTNISSISITRETSSSSTSTTSTITLADGSTYSNSSDKTYDEVSYTKTFSTANVWTPLYVPFSINIANYTSSFDIAEIVAFCPYSDTDGDGSVTAADDDVLVLTKKTSGTTSPNVPYLIRPKSATTYTIKASDGKLYAAKNGSVDCYTTKAVYTITGVYSPVYATTSNGYYFMSSGSMTTGSATINANSWYMSVTSSDAYGSSSSAKASIPFIVIGEDLDQTTAIQAVQTIAKDRQSNDVYTVSGVKVSNTSNLPAGIYIKCGKKFIVK